mgnify:CR=1 FL=1
MYPCTLTVDTSPPPLSRCQVSEVATLFDDDGILVRFMNSNVEGNGIRWVDVL